MTPSRIELATVGLVAQCLNQLRHPVPLFSYHLHAVMFKSMNESDVWGRRNLPVDIATWLRAGPLLNRASIPDKNFLLNVQTSFATHTDLQCSVYQEVLRPGVKWHTRVNSLLLY